MQDKKTRIFCSNKVFFFYFVSIQVLLCTVTFCLLGGLYLATLPSGVLIRYIGSLSCRESGDQVEDHLERGKKEQDWRSAAARRVSVRWNSELMGREHVHEWHYKCVTGRTSFIWVFVCTLNQLIWWNTTVYSPSLGERGGPQSRHTRAGRSHPEERWADCDHHHPVQTRRWGGQHHMTPGCLPESSVVPFVEELRDNVTLINANRVRLVVRCVFFCKARSLR